MCFQFDQIFFYNDNNISKWTEVTQSYAGLFFREEGGNSSSYGQPQLASAPHLELVHHHRIIKLIMMWMLLWSKE